MLKRVTGLLRTKKILQQEFPMRARRISCSVVFSRPRQPPVKQDSISPAIAKKYQIISDDVNQLESIQYPEDSYDKYSILSDEFDGINLERGKTGVFDIEDLVSLLNRENAKNIFVATVPPQINYVDYICVVSGRSKRHLRAIAEFVRKVYKKKCSKNDPIPKIEGEGSDEWMAIDLGNIALHVFSEKIRLLYDLETLWAVGREFDDQTHKKNDSILESYSEYLKDLKPL